MEDCPDGRMDRGKMQTMFKSIIPEVAAYKFHVSYIICIICTGRGWRPVSGAIVPYFRQGRGRQHRLQGVHDRDRHDEQRRPGGEAAMGLQDV